MTRSGWKQLNEKLKQGFTFFGFGPEKYYLRIQYDQKLLEKDNEIEELKEHLEVAYERLEREIEYWKERAADMERRYFDALAERDELEKETGELKETNKLIHETSLFALKTAWTFNHNKTLELLKAGEVNQELIKKLNLNKSFTKEEIKQIDDTLVEAKTIVQDTLGLPANATLRDVTSSDYIDRAIKIALMVHEARHILDKRHG